MGDMRAPLTAEEEVTLRRIALGSLQRLATKDVQRLRQLMLVEGEGEKCRLTPLGRKRYDKLVRPALRTNVDLMREIDRVLAMGSSPKNAE